MSDPASVVGPAVPAIVPPPAPVPEAPFVPAEDFRWPEERPGDRPREALPAPVRRAPRGRWVQWAVTAVGIAVGAAFYLLPAPAGLTPQGQAACAVFLVCATLWMTDVLPIGITGLMAVALLGLTGAMEPSEAFSAFGNPAVFFILGVFILAAATIHSGLSKRLALLFLRRFQQGPRVMAAGLMGTAAFLTVWMPAQATTAMLFPIALELAAAMKLDRGGSPYGKVLFLALAWGAMVGSNASFLGSTRAPLALGILERSTGQHITLVQWLIAALPVVLLGLVIGMLLLRSGFPRERVEMEAAKRMIDESVRRLGPMGSLQLRVAGVLGATICAWVVLGSRVDLAAMALVGAVALFAVRALEWKDLDGYVNWGVVLMYGGAIALGQAVEGSGAAEWLVKEHVDGLMLSPYVALAVLALATVVLTEFMSNAAAVAVMLPLGFSLAGQFGLSPVAVVLACSLAAGLDFTFPFSSAPNSIVYASGYLKMRDMLLVGSVMTVLQVLLLLLVARLWWPLLGIL